MQLERNVFPSPVAPEKIKFFVFSLSKLLIKSIVAFFISKIFSLGEILELYFFSFISSEYKLALKLLKLSDFIMFPFFLLY